MMLVVITITLVLIPNLLAITPPQNGPGCPRCKKVEGEGDLAGNYYFHTENSDCENGCSYERDDGDCCFCFTPGNYSVTKCDYGGFCGDTCASNGDCGGECGYCRNLSNGTPGLICCREEGPCNISGGGMCGAQCKDEMDCVGFNGISGCGKCRPVAGQPGEHCCSLGDYCVPSTTTPPTVGSGLCGDTCASNGDCGGECGQCLPFSGQPGYFCCRAPGYCSISGGTCGAQCKSDENCEGGTGECGKCLNVAGQPGKHCCSQNGDYCGSSTTTQPTGGGCMAECEDDEQCTSPDCPSCTHTSGNPKRFCQGN